MTRDLRWLVLAGAQRPKPKAPRIPLPKRRNKILRNDAHGDLGSRFADAWTAEPLGAIDGGVDRNRARGRRISGKRDVYENASGTSRGNGSYDVLNVVPS